MQVAPFKFG
jgi:hypothetical protein